MKFTRLLPILAVVALAAAACGESDPSLEATDTTAASEAADHNQADIAFLQGMIPHHTQAIEMSDLALERSENPEVVDLAERIKAAQGPEIEQMEALLGTWGAEAPSGGGGEHGGEHGGGGGMLSTDELSQLAEAEGAEFNRLYLEGMIAHHQGAVASSETELAQGESAEAKELAQEIIDAQEAEIAEMEQLLTEI